MEDKQDVQIDQPNPSFITSSTPPAVPVLPTSPVPASTPPYAPQTADIAYKAPDASSASAPIEPNTVTRLPILEPKGSKKIWLWLSILVVVIFLAAGGYLLYSTLAKSINNHKSVVSSVSPKSAPTLTAQNIITSVKSLKLQGTLIPIVKSDADSGMASGNVVVYASYPYQLTGNKFATTPSALYGAGTQGTQTAVIADLGAYRAYLGAHNFSLMKNEPYALLTTAPNQELVYISAKVLCQISYTHSTSTDMSSIACADLSSYADMVTKMQPFYNALALIPEQKVDSAPAVLLSSPVINKGVEGYMNASVDNSRVGSPFGGSAALFYQEPGKNWVYLTSTQDGLYCANINTAILQKAFAGQKCYDVTTLKDSVVTAP